ncbi:leucine-rich repeat extensin-like protein 3 [Iris pallida]|uniref:Leucine-rich repeat extensin-like protein 3 n=1 Tax=Iris pallida TaxID=29817 RepID=A0AAX6H901_IRIPA|nr:leucine-rich repeat extensin-like protein 3 [Iris pallida]
MLRERGEFGKSRVSLRRLGAGSGRRRTAGTVADDDPSAAVASCGARASPKRRGGGGGKDGGSGKLRRWAAVEDADCHGNWWQRRRITAGGVPGGRGFRHQEAAGSAVFPEARISADARRGVGGSRQTRRGVGGPLPWSGRGAGEVGEGRT